MCTPTLKRLYRKCIPTFSSFVILRAQFPSPLRLFPRHDEAIVFEVASYSFWEKVHVDTACILRGQNLIPFFIVFMYHMCIPRFQSVYPVCIRKTNNK